MTALVRPAHDLARSARSFVISSAVVLAAVDGFVVAAVRGAVGTVSRAQAPELTWLVQSGCLLPILLVGLALVVRLVQRRRTTEIAASLTVVATVALLGTVVGAGALAVDGAVDHHRQVAQSHDMPMAGGMLDPAVTERMVAAGVDVHVRAVGLGTLVLLVANVLAVLWVIALHEGRVTGPRRPS